MDYEENNKRLLNLYRESNDKKYIKDLYCDNINLFYRICNKFKGEEIEDLIQECYFALIKAVNTYKEESGAFGLYLAKMVTWHLFKYTRNNTTVRLPEYIQDLIKKYVELKAEKARTDKEICLLLEITSEDLADIKQAIIMKSVSSLDKTIDEEEELTLYDLIQDTGESLEDQALDSVFNHELRKAINEALENLSPVERDFVVYRFYKDMAYKEIDPEHSEHNTSQKIERALRKLRRDKTLQNFYEEENVLIGTGLTYFRQHRQSSVERAVFRKYGIKDKKE